VKRIGFLLLCTTAVATVAISVRGTYQPGCCSGRTIYDLSTWWLVVLLGVAALLVRFSTVTYRIQIGAGIGVTIGPQLAGTGVVAFRRWYTSSGFFQGPDRNIFEVRTLALMLCLTGLAATGASLLTLCKHGMHEVPRSTNTAKRVALFVGVFVAATLPYWMGHGRAGSMTTTALAAHALMYSLPWGFSFALSAWFNHVPAIAIAIALPISAIPLVGQYLMIWAFHPTTAFGIAVLGGAAIAATRWPRSVAQQPVAAELR
jgi:hypothetical protein